MKLSLCLALTGTLLTTMAFAQNISVGQKAPVFSLNRYGGGTVALADYPGKTIFINFFGSY